MPFNLKCLLTTTFVPLILIAAESNISKDRLSEKISLTYSALSSSSSYTKQFCHLHDMLLSAETEELQLSVIQEIRAFTNQYLGNPNSFDLMDMIYVNHSPLWERIEDLDFYRIIANTSNHPKRHKALHLLWVNGDPTDNAFAYSSLQNLAKEENMSNDEAALILFSELARSEVRNSVQNRVKRIAENVNNLKSKDAIIKLWQHESSENKNYVRQSMYSIVQNLKLEDDNDIDQHVKDSFLNGCCIGNRDDHGLRIIKI